MGQSLATESAEEAHHTRSTRSQASRSKRNLAKAKVDSAHPPLKSTLRTPSTTRETSTHQRRRRTSPLRETDGNARDAAAAAWGTDRKNRKCHQVRPDRSRSRSRSREPQADARPHRNHRKAEVRHHHRPKASPERNTRSRSRLHAEPQPASQPHGRHRKGKSAIIEVREKPPTKDCMICTDSRSLRHFPKRAQTAHCTHDVNTCRRCLRKWIQSSFKTKLWDQINCPECGLRMQYDDIREFAPPEIFRRYDRLATRAALEAIPGFRWCIAKGCKSGQVHDEGSGTPRFKCVSCKASHCVVHGIMWHKGETCTEYDYRTDGKIKKAEEKASKKLIKELAKQCPHCKWNIQKISGCDHMTCSKCRYEFCWQCLAPYKPIRDMGNSMHKPGCEYYADGTRVWV